MQDSPFTPTLFLIRHGQTTGDIENRYGGAYDDELTPLGKQQSRKVAEALKGTQLQAVYSSPLKRAKATAEIICQTLGLPTSHRRWRTSGNAIAMGSYRA